MMTAKFLDTCTFELHAATSTSVLHPAVSAYIWEPAVTKAVWNQVSPNLNDHLDLTSVEYMYPHAAMARSTSICAVL